MTIIDRLRKWKCRHAFRLSDLKKTGEPEDSNCRVQWPLSTADRHWSVPVSLIGTGVAYLGFAVWTSRKENAQKADRAFREIAKQARIIIESRKKRDIENGRAPRSEESHLNEINEPGFTYADYLKYKPE